MFNTKVEQVTFVADTVGVHHIEFSNTKWRCDFILNDFRTDALPDNLVTILELTNSSDIDPARAIELQRATANFLSDLIDEDYSRLAFGNGTGQFSHGLTHEPSLQADV